jgi:adenine phosphoribosyltransferase
MELKNYINSIKDYPIPGVLFRDVTPILKNADYFRLSIDKLSESLKIYDFDLIAAPEARGFIFASVLAYKLGKGLVPVRKKGKLPGEIISKSYSLEYGENTIEIKKDSIINGDRVLIFDDLLATGGTCKAVAELVQELGGVVVSMAFLIEVKDLGGREYLSGYDIISILKY